MTWKDQLLVVVLFQKIKASRLTERLLLKTVTLSTGKKYLMLEHIKQILEILQKDADFFARNEIIDYSLLVGINNKSEHLNSFYSQENSQLDAMNDRSDQSPMTLNTQNNSMASFD